MVVRVGFRVGGRVVAAHWELDAPQVPRNEMTERDGS